MMHLSSACRCVGMVCRVAYFLSSSGCSENEGKEDRTMRWKKVFISLFAKGFGVSFRLTMFCKREKIEQ